MSGRFDPLRLAEAIAEAAVILAVTALPVAWRNLDSSRTAVLGGMLALLSAGVYALHAVTFDYFRLSGHREKRSFSYTRSED